MSETRKAKIGFIGAGGFATASLYPQIRFAPIDLVAVCDIDREKAELNARNFGGRRVYTNITEMLDKEELDGVFCVGSAPQQFELAPLVLKRGLPVYVEKPSANTSKDARELAELAEANGTWGQVGFMKRFADVYHMAKDVVGRPEFGPLHMLKLKFGQGPYQQIWGIDSGKRAFLIGQLVHIFDLARFFGGDIETISAMYYEASDTQFAYAVNCKYKSGVLGTFDLNALEATNFRDISEELQLIGLGTNVLVKDMMSLDWQPREDWTKVAPSAGRYLHSFQPSWTGMSYSPRTYGYAGEVINFARRCIGEVDSGPDLWDSYHALKIGEAVYESSHTGRVVTIER